LCAGIPCGSPFSFRGHTQMAVPGATGNCGVAAGHVCFRPMAKLASMADTGRIADLDYGVPK
jgi:hypothetical protein